jgi:acetyl-CoA carboxylase biotin carboxylase subunit
MLAKLIVYAPTRERAIDRMHRALLELTVAGIETSRGFHLRVMEDAEFREGAIEIQWLERRLPSLTAVRPPVEGMPVAAMAAALLANEDRTHRARPMATTSSTHPASDALAWRQVARREGVR